MKKDSLQEQLEKFKLYSNYSSSQTLDENIENIFEQYSSPEEEIYYTLLRAAGGPGTNIPLLKKAFGLFKDGKQLMAVEKMMSEKPLVGYKTISGLLRGELETDNQKDLEEIQKVVAPKGISVVAPIKKTASGLPYPDMKSITIKVGSAVSGKPVTPKVTSPDEPTGDLAKVKDLPGVTVTAKKKGSTVQFRNNEKFPLKFMDKGQLITQIQNKLGVKPTGNFYTGTEKAVSDKMASLGMKYDRNVGVDEETFNAITSGPKRNVDLAQVKVDRTRPDLSVNAPTNLPTKAPNITPNQQPQGEVSLEQQFANAKVELAKAVQDLNILQRGNATREQIRAGRDVQQAARKKVQDLRAKLYPPTEQ
jgi:hypothetical protein